MQSLFFRRLQSEIKEVQKNPVPHVRLRPMDESLRKWMFVFFYIPNSPYENGVYFGYMTIPENYPHKSPDSVKMITPSGRFYPNQELCVSSVKSAHYVSQTLEAFLVGILSYMMDDKERGEGTFACTDEQRRKYAETSMEYNLANTNFCKLFPEAVANHEWFREQ